MKKGLIIGGSIAAVVLIGAAIGIGIAAGGQKSVEELNGIHEITFFSNFPGYQNNGFNNSPHEGSVRYERDYLQNPANTSDTDKEVGMVQTSTYDDTGQQYVQEIADAYNQGAEKIVSAGFQVANSLIGGDENGLPDLTFVDFGGVWGKPDVEGNVEGHENEYFALLDDTLMGSVYANGISVNFHAEGAGYLASLPAALYTTWNTNKLNEGKTEGDANWVTPNIVMWGGIGYNTVYSFMSGFAQGITEFNTYAASDETDAYEEITLWSGYDETSDSVYGSTPVDSTEDVWYSGGFTADSGAVDGQSAISRTNNAIAQSASVVFPIAGGNTAIALDILSGNTKGTKVIGVDTDNTIDYDAYSDLILGSATKSLELSTYYSLWAMDDFDNDGIVNGKEGAVDPADPMAEEAEAFLSDWAYSTDDYTDVLGQAYTGTMENGGVGFTFVNANNGNGQEGMNIDLLQAMIDLDIATDEAEAISILETQFESAKSTTVEAADDAFVYM